MISILMKAEEHKKFYRLSCSNNSGYLHEIGAK